MNKLTADDCKAFIATMRVQKSHGILSIAGEYHLQAMEIALPVLEQQESPTDTYRQIENDDWIEWEAGYMPESVRGDRVQVRYASGETETDYSGVFNWGYGAGDLVIAYRVIENDEREG